MPTEKNIKWLFISFLVFWVILLLLTGCSVEKKSQRKVAYLLAHDKMDEACARLFPVRDSVVTKDSTHFDTLYVENNPIIKTDTVYKNDTVFITQSVKCPPEKVITKTVHDSVFTYRTNTAEVERLKGELLDKEAVIKAKDEVVLKQQVKIEALDKWKIYFIILCSLNVLAFVVRFFVIKRPI
jgi:uncharacterized protein YpmS